MIAPLRFEASPPPYRVLFDHEITMDTMWLEGTHLCISWTPIRVSRTQWYHEVINQKMYE